MVPLESVWATFLWAVGGGLAAEALRWWRLVQNQRSGATLNLPAYVRSPFYWALTLLVVLAGGMLAVAYAASGEALGPILAVNIGASAPLIIQGLAASTPAPSGVRPLEAARPSPRNFLSGR
ncbi:MAG: hypothetical protein P8Z81_01035 [Deinococcales bacterium]